MRQFHLELFADYCQFYIRDEMAAGDLSESWNEETSERLLAVAAGTVGIGTVRDMTVPVCLELHDAEPEDDFDVWDHVTECALEAPSGRLVIAGCTDCFPDAKRIEVVPGSYRVRASYGSLKRLSEDGLDGDDHYRIQIWQASPIEPRVLKMRRV